MHRKNWNIAQRTDEICDNTDSFQHPFSREKQMCHVIYQARIIYSLSSLKHGSDGLTSRKKTRL